MALLYINSNNKGNVVSKHTDEDITRWNKDWGQDIKEDPEQDIKEDTEENKKCLHIFALRRSIWGDIETVGKFNYEYDISHISCFPHAIGWIIDTIAQCKVLLDNKSSRIIYNEELNTVAIVDESKCAAVQGDRKIWEYCRRELELYVE